MPKYDNTSQTQCERILKYFQTIKPTLIVTEAREILGIMCLPARIMELRGQGYIIHTNWIFELDKNGVKHRNGQYSYHGKKEYES